MRSLVLQLTRTEGGTRRQLRGIFHLVGHVEHSLFGMLDSDSEAFYNQKISVGEETVGLAETDARKDYCCSVNFEIRKSDPT